MYKYRHMHVKKRLTMTTMFGCHRRELMLLSVQIVSSHHQFEGQLRFNMELSLLPAGVLERPVKVLADLLENGGAYLGESDFSVLRLSETPWRGEHIADGLRDHGGLLIDDEFEALGADQLHSVFLPHLGQTPPQYPQYSSGYIPPPWAPTPGYYSNQNNLSPVPHNFPTPQTNTPSSYRTVQVSRPLKSFPTNEETRVATAPAAAGSKPFVPSYRLFEDLNVLGNGDGRFKMTSSTMPSLSGASSHSMVGGRK